MNVRRGGLGRGLGALIPAGPAADDASGARFEDLPIDAIEPNPRQPREAFDEEALAELVASVREVGVLQPVVVRELSPGRYQLVMGERRWRACREAGLETVPAIIRETADNDLLRDALLENLHRQQLNPLEEAAAYQQLLAEFGATHEELAERIGRSRPQVSNTIRLLSLPPTVQRRVAAGVLSAGHARALLSLDDAETQERLAARIVAEGLSVRATEELVAVGERPAKPRARASHGRRRRHSPGSNRRCQICSRRE
jgi:ParB family chromosome partitioning protein